MLPSVKALILLILILLQHPFTYGSSLKCGPGTLLPISPQIVTTMVPRLYDAIPISEKVRISSKLSVVTKHPDYGGGPDQHTFQTGLQLGKSREVDWHINGLTMNLSIVGGKKLLQLDAISRSPHREGFENLDIPKWISPDGVPSLVPGKGVPLLVFEILHQMKRFRIGKGGLTQAKIFSLQNPETVLTLAQNLADWRSHRGSEPNAHDQGEMLRDTPIVRNFTTALIQSGHVVKQIVVESFQLKTFGKILSDYTHDSAFPELREHWQRQAEELGIDAGDILRTNLYVRIDLEKL